MLQNTSLIEKKMFYGLREFLKTFQSNTCLLEKTTGRLSWILLLNHMFFPMWDLRACAFLSRYRLLDGILNPYIRSVQKGCYRNFKCVFMGVLRLSLDLVSSKFAIQSYKLTNLSQNMPRNGSSLLVAIHSKCQWQQVIYVIKICSKYDIPECDVACPNACYMTVMSFQNWLVEYRVYLGLSSLLKLTWNKTPSVSTSVQMIKWEKSCIVKPLWNSNHMLAENL